MKQFLGKATGLSRTQLTRLIGQRTETGRIVDRRGGAPAKPFVRRYTARDVVLLAQVDETLEQVCHSPLRDRPLQAHFGIETGWLRRHPPLGDDQPAGGFGPSSIRTVPLRLVELIRHGLRAGM